MLLCRTDQHLQETLPSVTAAKGGHTRYWKQRFTYFCNAQICNTGYFFSINKWQRKYFSLTCLIRFSLSTFRTYMKIWWCFGSNLCRNIDNSKGFTNFKAALYVYIHTYTYIHRLYIGTCDTFFRILWWIKNTKNSIYSKYNYFLTICHFSLFINLKQETKYWPQTYEP